MSPGPRTFGPSGWCWRLPRKRGRVSLTNGWRHRRSRTSTCRRGGWRCRRWPRRPGCRPTVSPLSSSRRPVRRIDALWVDRTRPMSSGSSRSAHDVLVWPPVAELAASLDGPGRATAVAMLAVRATAPGVPDIYQGTEAFRSCSSTPTTACRPTSRSSRCWSAGGHVLDAAAAWNGAAQPSREGGRAAPVAGAAPPSARGLRTRRRLRPAERPTKWSIIAFARTDGSGAARVVTVIARPGVTPRRPLPLPAGRWRHVLVDDATPVEGELDVGDALGAFPAVVLVRE